VEVLADKAYVEKKDIEGTKANQTTLTIQPTQWPPLTHISQVPLGAEKGKLVPTALGESVLQFCVREFPQLFAYEFTAQMEGRLDRVAKGEEEWKQLCRDTWNSYKDDHARLNDKASVPSASEKVKELGEGLKAVMSKTGPLLVQEAAKSTDKPTFYPFPPDSTVQGITAEEARAWILKQSEGMGTWDGKAILKKKGPYGDYLQCGDYKVPYQPSDTSEMIIQKFKDRAASASNLYVFGPYTFGSGQYGPYMYKTALKTKVFVKVPPTLDVKTLTGDEADTIYKNGIAAKSARGGHGGRGRGRGRGR